MYLSNDFLLFLFFKACTSNVIVVQEMLWFLSLQINYIKFIWTVGINSRLDQLQVSQKYSEQICKRYQLYPVRLSTDILCSSLDSFDFLSSCFVVVVAVVFFWIKNIYNGTLSNIPAGEWFPETRDAGGLFPETRLLFLSLNMKFEYTHRLISAERKLLVSRVSHWFVFSDCDLYWTGWSSSQVPPVANP